MDVLTFILISFSRGFVDDESIDQLVFPGGGDGSDEQVGEHHGLRDELERKEELPTPDQMTAVLDWNVLPRLGCLPHRHRCHRPLRLRRRRRLLHRLHPQTGFLRPLRCHQCLPHHCNLETQGYLK